MMSEAIRAHRLGDRVLLLEDLNLAHDEALEEGRRGKRRGGEWQSRAIHRRSGNQEQSRAIRSNPSTEWQSRAIQSNPEQSRAIKSNPSTEWHGPGGSAATKSNHVALHLTCAFVLPGLVSGRISFGSASFCCLVFHVSEK
jgi:hypothetical protein